METDFILLKAQHEALRTYTFSLLPTIFKNDLQQQMDDSKVWLAKYLLWCFERENLSPFDYKSDLPVPEKEKISHRRFQLQVLMDVAYTRGHLEGYDIIRAVSRDAAALADTVYSHSNGSEADMCRVIDEIYKS